MKEAGLVSAVYPAAEFSKIAMKRLEELSNLPPESVMLSKSIIRNAAEREKLHQVNQAECDILRTRYSSDEVINAVVAFMARKSK